MSKFRIFYIASLVVLGVLMTFTVFRPMASEEEFGTVSRGSVIQKEDEYIIQFDILNREGKDTNYIINWSTGQETYNSKTVSIKNGRTFTNIHHVYQDTVKEGEVHLSIYKEGEATPFEDCTYYICFEGAK